MQQRRRRVSRKRNAGEAEMDQDSEVVNVAVDVAAPVVTDVAKRQNIVAAAAAATPLEWGSKQPKQVDKDILRYALTTGGELAQKQQSAELEEEVEAIRNNLFVEITEGEASLACDKRGSRVLQNLIKHAKSETAICALAERLKPYVGHLAYEPFASHVIQTLVESPFCSREWKLDFCAQISRVNEWWALMHHPSGTHVARSLVVFIKPEKAAIGDLFQSLMEGGSQEDLSSACRNQAAGPFLSQVVSQILTPAQKIEFVRKLLLLQDEVVNTRELEAIITHPVGSRVMEVLTGEDCNALWKPWAMDNLQRLVFHPIANFVAQRLVEHERDAQVLGKICTACPVKALLERDRVGVLNAIIRSITAGHVPALLPLQLKMSEDLLQAELVDHAITMHHHQQHGGRGKRERVEEDTSTKMHAGLLETMYLCLTLLSPAARKPIAGRVLALDAKQLLLIARDSLGGRKIIEPLLELENDEENIAFDLAKRFKTHFETLVLDRNGVHVAKKAFAALKRADRIKIMEEEIEPNEQKLNGAGPWGHAFLVSVKCAEFKVNAKEWSRKMDLELSAKTDNAANNSSSSSGGVANKKKSSVKEAWKKELNL